MQGMKKTSIFCSSCLWFSIIFLQTSQIELHKVELNFGTFEIFLFHFIKFISCGSMKNTWKKDKMILNIIHTNLYPKKEEIPRRKRERRFLNEEKLHKPQNIFKKKVRKSNYFQYCGTSQAAWKRERRRKLNKVSLKAFNMKNSWNVLQNNNLVHKKKHHNFIYFLKIF